MLYEYEVTVYVHAENPADALDLLHSEPNYFYYRVTDTEKNVSVIVDPSGAVDENDPNLVIGAAVLTGENLPEPGNCQQRTLAQDRARDERLRVWEAEQADLTR